MSVKPQDAKTRGCICRTTPEGMGAGRRKARACLATPRANPPSVGLLDDAPRQPAKRGGRARYSAKPLVAVFGGCELWWFFTPARPAQPQEPVAWCASGVWDRQAGQVVARSQLTLETRGRPTRETRGIGPVVQKCSLTSGERRYNRRTRKREAAFLHGRRAWGQAVGKRGVCLTTSRAEPTKRGSRSPARSRQARVCLTTVCADTARRGSRSPTRTRRRRGRPAETRKPPPAFAERRFPFTWSG